jgi:putative membrane protein
MSDISRKEGKNFTPEEESQKQSYSGRQPKLFTPDVDSESNVPPESITAGERLPDVADLSSIRLEALPLKGLKSFSYVFVTFLVLLLGWDIYLVLQSALQSHWLIAMLYLALLLLVVGLALRVGFSYLQGRQDIQTSHSMRHLANCMRSSRDLGSSSKLVKEMSLFYAAKPQAIHWQHSIDNLPDYANDQEVVTHIEHHFLRPLDEEVMKRISNYSLQVGIAVALSPWASLDMALSLWRNLKMIDEVGQLYGVRPSLRNRYKLLKKVITQLAFVGASEVAIDQINSELGTASVMGMAGGRLTQGVGVGIYTAKIGIAAMEVSRPIQFVPQQQPKLKSLIKPLIQKAALFRVNQNL